MMSDTKHTLRVLRSSRILIPLILVFVIILSSAGFIQQRSDDLFELRKNFEIFGALYEQIVVGYVDEVRPQPLMRSGVDAMLEQLDPYTRYYDEADMTRLRLLRDRGQADVGLAIGIRGGRIVVLAPDTETEPYEQGIRTGDILIQVADKVVEGLSVEEVYLLMIGEPGSTVDVTVQRSGEDLPRTFTFRRRHQATRNVTHSGFMNDDTTRGFAYVKLNQFGERAARETRRTLRSMDRERELQGIILDLRSNPGGILREAIDLVDMFIPRGTAVVSTRARAEGLSQVYKTDRDPLFPETPLVVLMNQFSASASEIVAGALQDYDRAVIVGTPSFGKGLVQIVRELPHNTSLKMTVSRYYTPSGRSIQSAQLASDAARVSSPSVRGFTTEGGRPVRSGVGIEPDIAGAAPVEGPLTAALNQQGVFFLFADAYVAEACSGGNASCIQDQDRTYAAFRDFIDRVGFTWKLPLEKTLLDLRSQMEEQGVGREGGELAALEARIARHKNESFSAERVALMRAIKKELRSRLLDESTKFRAELAEDPWIAESLSLLDDTDRMSNILSSR